MSNILHVCGWFDPAGDVTRIVSELNKYSAHKHEAIVKFRHPKCLQFPEPDGQSRDEEYVKARFDWADALIYHLVTWDSPYGYMVKPNKPCAFRNVNVMCDGHRFYCLPEFTVDRNSPDYKLVGTCHCGGREFLGEDAAFLPALMPINDDAYLPDWTDRVPAVCFIKNTDEIASEFAAHPGTEHFSLLDKPFDQVIRARKHRATVTIDNICDGHYGLAGTESLSQGIPAIAWNNQRTLAQLDDIAPGAGNPFIQATTVQEAVAIAIEWSTKERSRYGVAARQCVRCGRTCQSLTRKYWEPFCDTLLR